MQYTGIATPCRTRPTGKRLSASEMEIQNYQLENTQYHSVAELYYSAGILYFYHPQHPDLFSGE